MINNIGSQFITNSPPSTCDSDPDISSLNSAILKRDFEKIIKNSELFWLAYCKALSQIEGGGDEYFSIALHEHTVTISGMEHIIVQVKKFLEQIRLHFVKEYDKKNETFFILLVEESGVYIIKEKTEVLDLRNWSSGEDFNLPTHFFRDYVQPTMQRLCESVGARCSDLTVSQKIIHEFSPVKDVAVKAFRIDWGDGEYFVYPIEAKTIPLREDLQKSMHSMYLNQVLCDLSLVANDGAIRVHSIPLFTYGGEMIKTMLTVQMTELLKKEIQFREFSLNSVKAFVDFIYLGEKGLEPGLVLEKNVDLSELFRMAHTYQVPALIDCCTNLMSLFATPNDIANIKYLAEVYDNAHLKELHDYLCSKLNPTQAGFIKV